MIGEQQRLLCSDADDADDGSVHDTLVLVCTFGPSLCPFSYFEVLRMRNASTAGSGETHSIIAPNPSHWCFGCAIDVCWGVLWHNAGPMQNEEAANTNTTPLATYAPSATAFRCALKREALRVPGRGGEQVPFLGTHYSPIYQAYCQSMKREIDSGSPLSRTLQARLKRLHQQGEGMRLGGRLSAQKARNMALIPSPNGIAADESSSQ
ncbi:hypothetical protein EV363DRAFT_1403188 [Boletus edulis]|nr:hypothetical protein EV363DRAFT_1403188 [Boletus edulis]